MQNDFGETDVVVDLFYHIHKAYAGKHSVFDNMKTTDTIIAFFPCVRFSDQAMLQYRCENHGMKNYTDIQKLDYSLQHHAELQVLYELITQLFIICLRKNIPLIVENPYSVFHYLKNYFPIKPKVIDKNRRGRGDYYKKPTQYWFVNCEPKCNTIFEGQPITENKTIRKTHNTTERSLISPEYANRFIREFIIDA